jgi:pyruvate dehydrogenase E1 component beta subunit
MQTMSAAEAIGQAIAEEMRRDGSVMMFGEGVATKRPELVSEFGDARVRNTPLAEGIIAGAAVGAAAMGLRPVIDLLFAPFMALAMDEIVNSAGKLRYVSGGQFSFPLVAMAMCGTGWTVGSQHNQSIEAWFVHSPGLVVAMPSTAADFKGLMKASIRNDNPVVFFVEMGLLHETGEVPAGEHVVPLGKAAVRRAGKDVTLVAYGKAARACVAAATVLEGQGIAAEVIDLRTLKPLDEAAILASVRKTGRVVVVHDANRTCGVGAEVAAIVAEKAFDALRAPVIRLASPDVPTPSSYPLELAYAPQPEGIAQAVAELVRRSPAGPRTAVEPA